jgi:2-oxoglutarate ferredoxin oxidoreductase subunit alpha
MIYDGVLSHLLGVDLAQMEKALFKQLGKKPKAMQLNMGALEAGKKFAEENLTIRHAHRVEPLNKTDGQILIEGNQAAAMGCMFAGVTVRRVVSDYALVFACPKRSSATCGSTASTRTPARPTFAIVQAEDEIAAIGMVIGASWAGARAMTSTSGPGVSLMSEFAGLAYYAEVPAVVFDIQRVGPSTGLPTRTAQGDILSTAVNSHGDTRHVMLLPSSPEECYTMAMDSFDLAERLQTIVYVMCDLDLGMNTWMAYPFTYPDKPLDRGKILDEAKVKELGTWGRYKDVDGDAIPWRSLPGTSAPAFFTRGSGHNEMAQYSERADDYVKNLDRLARKFDTAKTIVPAPVLESDADASVGIIAYGSSHYAVQEGRDQLREETGLKSAYLRLRAYPFGPEVEAFVRRFDRVYVVEQNRDAQMLSLLRLGPGSGALSSTSERPALRRSADRRPQHFRFGPRARNKCSSRNLRTREPENPENPRTREPENLIMSDTTTPAPVPPKKVNRLGLEMASYRGGKTTLCAGCGHNAISERVIDAFYEMGVDPKRVMKFSGIGCSSKSPAYFLNPSHGFNSVHGTHAVGGDGRAARLTPRCSA